MQRRTFLRTTLTLGGLSLVSQDLFALKYYPQPSNKKIAIIYSTWCGSSRDAAVWISEGMGGIADVFDVREEPTIEYFDHIIIGGSIRYGQVSKELCSFLENHKEELRKKVRGYFIVCGNMRKPVGTEEKVKYIDKHLATFCGVENLPSRVFNGRVTKRLLDNETRALIERFEDYDDLRRSLCLDYGAELLKAMF
ncbi:MAG: flavodoxin domain-containing protein [Bacteroidetes bacterium]|nr:flavodoxin domain-containing protein [Bacteroidota bacterium]